MTAKAGEGRGGSWTSWSCLSHTWPLRLPSCPTTGNTNQETPGEGLAPLSSGVRGQLEQGPGFHPQRCRVKGSWVPRRARVTLLLCSASRGVAGSTCS